MDVLTFIFLLHSWSACVAAWTSLVDDDVCFLQDRMHTSQHGLAAYTQPSHTPSDHADEADDVIEPGIHSGLTAGKVQTQKANMQTRTSGLVALRASHTARAVMSQLASVSPGLINLQGWQGREGMVTDSVPVDAPVKTLIAPTGWQSYSPSVRCAILIAVLLVVCLSGILSACFRLPDQCEAPESSVDHSGLQLRLIQFLACGSGIMSLQVTVIIPEALDFAEVLNNGAVFSGWMIGVPWASGILGSLGAKYLMTPWDQKLSKWSICLCAFSQAAIALMSGVIANPPTWLNMSSQTSAIAFMGMRCSIGMLDVLWCAPLKQMMQKISPNLELVTLGMITQSCNGMGMGFGPIISAFIITVTGAVDIRLRMCLPLYFVAAILGCWAAACMLWIPSDIERLSRAKDKGDAAASQEHGQAFVVPNEDSTKVFHKKQLWIASISVGMMRACAVSGLESASSLIFQTEFGMDTATIGVTIGSTFIVVLIPMTLVVSCLVRGEVCRDTFICLVLGICCCLCSSLLFRFMGGFWMIVVADSFIYPTAYVASGIARGWALRFSMPNSFFCSENLLLLGSVVENAVGRLVGPPLARVFVSTGGRSVYAGVQVLITFLLAILMWKAAIEVNKVRGVDSDTSHKTSDRKLGLGHQAAGA